MTGEKKKTIKILNTPSAAAYVFILPSVIILTLFTVLPICISLIMSFLNIDIFLSKISFSGMNHYLRIMSDSRFWNALRNTVYFTILEVPLQVIFALFVANYVRKNTLFRKFLRSTLFIPAVCSMTAIGILWSVLLDSNLGYYTYLFKIIGFTNIGFLKDPLLAMPTVIIMTVWKTFGLNMIILVSGIQGISDSYYEAATVDGASSAIQFTNITLPLLAPTLTFCLITNTIDALKVFDQVYVMTQGGPMFKTETIVSYIYNVGFKIAPFNLGYASAIAQVLFVLIGIVTMFIYKNAYKDKE